MMHMSGGVMRLLIVNNFLKVIQKRMFRGRPNEIVYDRLY
jgi:hypothetical protein